MPLEHLSLKRVKAEMEEAKKRERDWEHSRLEMMRLYAEETGCRRQFLLAYFGEMLPQPCGHCDNCTRLTRNATPETPCPLPVSGPLPDPEPRFPVGIRVAHKAWGQSQVLRYDGEKVVISFDGAGYKTLAVAVITQNKLLEVV